MIIISNNPIYGITCEKDSNTNTPICKGTGLLSAYHLKWTPNPIFGSGINCEESLLKESQSEVSELRESCEDGLPLFGKALDQAQEKKNTQPNTPPKPSPSNTPAPATPDSDTKAWSTGVKLAGVGIAGAICLGLYAKHRAK